MSRNRDLAAASGVLLVAWLTLAFASGFADKYLTSEEQLIGWGLGVLVLVFIPLVRDTARWTALGAALAGIIWVIIELMNLITFPTEAFYGPALSLVFSALFTYFSFAAYREKKPLA